MSSREERFHVSIDGFPGSGGVYLGPANSAEAMARFEVVTAAAELRDRIQIPGMSDTVANWLGELEKDQILRGTVGAETMTCAQLALLHSMRAETTSDEDRIWAQVGPGTDPLL